MNHELTLIGAGNMGEAIARGLLAGKTLPAERMVAVDSSEDRRRLFQNELRIQAVATPQEAGPSRMVLLAVKPQQMPDLLALLKAQLDERSLIISIAAGVTTAGIAGGLGDSRPWRIVRLMPNTPMLVGSGMAAICPGKHATTDDLAAARRLFEPAADVIQVEESQMDAVTAVSGSGPAYFFYLVEQMTAAGVELGLSPRQADQLARVTARGAAEMLMGSELTPGELRKKVTSPGGTTQAAIEHMKLNHWDRITCDALRAAARRSAELSG